MIAIFANSAGWNDSGPIADAEVRAVDLRPIPGTRGSSSSTMPPTAIV